MEVLRVGTISKVVPMRLVSEQVVAFVVDAALNVVES